MRFMTAMLVAALGMGAGARAAEEQPAHYEAVNEFVAEKLDGVEELSGAQKEKIRAIIRDKLPAIQKLVRRFVAEQQALKATATAESVDESAIRAQASKLGGVLADLAVLRAKLTHEVGGVLSAEQLENFRAQGHDWRKAVAGFLDEVAKRLATE